MHVFGGKKIPKFVIFNSFAVLWITFVTAEKKKKYHPKQTNFVACLLYEQVIWQFDVQNKFGKEWTAISDLSS